MKAEVGRDQRRLSLALPWDLSEWVAKETLAQWIREDIDALNWGNPELVQYLKQRPDYKPRELLRVLTYAFAVGVFESEEIFSGCQADSVLRSLLGEAAPSVQGLSRFRRENRGLLKWTLAQVLTRALRAKYGLRQTLIPAGIRRTLVQNAVERIDLGRHLDRTLIGE